LNDTWTASPVLILNSFYRIFGFCKMDSESGSVSQIVSSQKSLAF
jgi:hypothetical protein